MIIKFLRQQVVLFITGAFLVSLLYACQGEPIAESPTPPATPMTQDTVVATQFPP